jgi:serine protease Do
MSKHFASVVVLGACAFAGTFMAGLLGPRINPPIVAQVPGPANPVPQPIPLIASPTPPADQPLGPAPAALVQLSERLEQVARRLLPAVVAIEAVKPAQPNVNKGLPVEDSGSGVLVPVEGRAVPVVLTNNHVVSGARPENVTISLSDGRIYKAAQIWTDPETDVAVVRIDGVALPAAKLGDSDRVRVGHFVLAFGSPFGLKQSVTHGIISARERGQVHLGSTIRIKEFLQTDAAINPGSSGGPLVNLDGEVIGINTAIASRSGSSSGVSFSIPINLARSIMKQLLERGSVARGYLGVQLVQVFEPADALRLGLDRTRGALVEAVYADTPAAAAGLKVNDVILQLNGQPIRSENHFINLISETPAGQRVRLQVWRDRRLLELEAVVGDWAEAQSRLRSGR